MILILSLLASAWAQVTSDLMQVQITVDDQAVSRLAGPMLEVVGREGSWPFVDDGSVQGDTSGDGIWTVRIEISRTEELVFRIHEQGSLLDQFTHRLPNAPEATYAYRSQAGEPPLVELQVLDSSPAPQVEPDRAPPPADASATPEVGDSIDIVLIVDDRSLGRLVEPVLLVDQVDIPKMAIRDDGSVPGDTAGDGIWMAELSVRRSEFLIMNLIDEGAQVGQLKAFLPSSDEAEIRVMTTSDGSGLELISEATSSGGVGGPSGVSTGPGGGRLAHVLWVLIALFAVLFTYLRQVVWKTWNSEVKPLLDRAGEESSEAEE
jgi:hypothetical protein